MSSEIAQESKASATQQASAQPPSFRSGFTRYLRGNLGGQLPVVFTLVLIAIFFQITSNGLFLSSRNLSFLVLQIATLGTISLGSTLVLLIGEIDLSMGVVSYTTASIMVFYSLYHNWPTIPAILLGLAAGAVIGLINGFFVAVLRVPSFIVTLAGLLAYQGYVIYLLFPQTSINISDPNINNLATNYLLDTFGIGLPAIAIILYVVGTLFARIQRQRNGLAVEANWAIGIRIVVAILLVIGVITLFESYRGVPQSAAILVGLILLFWLILRFTSFGRHVYAVGGNAEAARRAGINVTRTRIFVFMLASVLAAVGGLLQASRSGVATAQVDQTLLLNAIAIAVIGGVSLFGGRGSVWGIVLGSLVIGSISNGMALLDQNSYVVYIVEGVVLLIAVTADAVARRQRIAGAR